MQSPFIKKLKAILDDSNFTDIICWTHQGTYIQIKDEKKFQQFVLPKFFRHTHLASFIRQLNLYGFRKVRSSHSQVFTHQILENGNRIQEICAKKKLLKIKQKELESKKDQQECNQNNRPSRSLEKERTATKETIEKPGKKVVEAHTQKCEEFSINSMQAVQSVNTNQKGQMYQSGSWMYLINPMSTMPMPTHMPVCSPPYSFYHWN